MDFDILASSDNAPYAAIGNAERGLFRRAVPSRSRAYGARHDMLRHFVIDICGAEQDWTPANFIEASIQAIRDQVGSGRVLLGMSGGVDSVGGGGADSPRHRRSNWSLSLSINGMLRQGEPEAVVDNVSARCAGRSRGGGCHRRISRSADAASPIPKPKRSIIGATFIEVFEREAAKQGQLDWLAQGTIYPDVIESAGTGRPGAQRIKSHHNVGGLPDRFKSRLVEPLRDLFKDEVRAVGTALGLPDEIVWRQPFPGPGLGCAVWVR